MRKAAKPIWQIIVLITGLAVLVVGLALLVVPGPGLLVLLLGLLILSTEFSWAKGITENLKQRLKKQRADKTDQT